MKRAMCVWVPNWPIQRVQKERGERSDRPLVLYTAAARGTLTVTACSRSAARAGVRVNMPLAEVESIFSMVDRGSVGRDISCATSPKGATVNSQGREPLVAANDQEASPKGAKEPSP